MMFAPPSPDIVRMLFPDAPGAPPVSHTSRLPQPTSRPPQGSGQLMPTRMEMDLLSSPPSNISAIIEEAIEEIDLISSDEGEDEVDGYLTDVEEDSF